MVRPTLRGMEIGLSILLLPTLAWGWRMEKAGLKLGPPFSNVPVEAALLDNWGKEEPVTLNFKEMYQGASSLGIEFSSKLKSLAGRRVSMTGFMAPPLKPTLAFFVLTKVPMAICPFCSTDADWPDDIVVVRLSRPVVALPYDRPIRVTGTLGVGSAIDDETGFVSLVRIKADSVETVK